MAEGKVKALSHLFSRLTAQHLKDELTPKELHEVKNKIKDALALHEEAKSARKKPSEKTDAEFEKWSRLEIAKGDAA